MSGYRSLVRFDGTDRDLGVELAVEAQRLDPGEVGTVDLRFWATDDYPALSEGQNFELREGERIVGTGTITSTAM
jgi:translation elongation factor EF-Tu-like GTPase